MVKFPALTKNETLIFTKKKKKSCVCKHATFHIVQNIQELQKLNETLFELFPHEIFASKKYYWCVHREPKLSSNMLQNFGGVDVFSASTS